MSKHEIEQQLSRLKRDLEEIEDERKFVLGQTGIHLPGKTVRNYEDEMSVLRKMITRLEESLSE